MRGHLRKRSGHSWTIYLDLGRDPVTGKRRQKGITVQGTRRDAERRLAEMLTELDTGGFVEPTKATLAEYLSQWLRDYAASHVRARTAEVYRGWLMRRVIPHLGQLRLSELRPSHLQGLYARLLKEGRLDGKPGGLSARSVLHTHRILSEALSHAVKWGLVARNVAQAVDPPRPENVEMRTLDREEIRAVLEAAQGSEYYPIIHLALYTGMRRSELLGLRWRDVDLEMAVLSVVQVMQVLKGGKVVYQEPKSAKSRRRVDLPPQAALALRAHKERREADCAFIGTTLTADALVFAHADSSPILPSAVTHAFGKIARKAGVQGVRFHDLRHTHATLLLQQGVHPKIVQERLGHATISTTLDTYSHVTPGLQKAAARRFEEALGDGLTPMQTTDART